MTFCLFRVVVRRKWEAEVFREYKIHLNNDNDYSNQNCEPVRLNAWNNVYKKNIRTNVKYFIIALLIFKAEKKIKLDEICSFMPNIRQKEFEMVASHYCLWKKNLKNGATLLPFSTSPHPHSQGDTFTWLSLQWLTASC